MWIKTIHTGAFDFFRKELNTAKKFESERCVVTMGVNEKMNESASFLKFVRISIGRHFNGDWGEMPEEDKKENERALKSGFGRLMSAYVFIKGKTVNDMIGDFKQYDDETKIWIITEWDRSVTTVLFPHEY